MQEVDLETLRRALIVVDSRQAALAEAGDLIKPIEAGAMSLDAIHAELGEIVSGAKPGRTTAEQVTLFKSVGVAVQDAAAAGRALANALETDIGHIIEL